MPKPATAARMRSTAIEPMEYHSVKLATEIRSRASSKKKKAIAHTSPKRTSSVNATVQ